MKKFLLRCFMLVLLTGLLGACSVHENQNGSGDGQTQHPKSGQSNGTTVKTGSVNIILSENKGETTIGQKKIAVKKGDILMDVLKENFKIEEDKGFIKSIDGIAPKKGEKKAWMYSVNGKMAKVGATDYKLKPGDEVIFDLQSWE